MERLQRALEALDTLQEEKMGGVYDQIRADIEQAIEEQKYNGWKNRETWAAALWLNNEEGTYKYWRGQAAEAKNEEYPAVVLADQIEEALEDGAPDIGTNIYSDLLTGALAKVDYMEIAKDFLQD